MSNNTMSEEERILIGFASEYFSPDGFNSDGKAYSAADEALKKYKKAMEQYTLSKQIEALSGVQLFHRNTRTEIVSIVDGAILPIDERIAELRKQQEEV